jgi:hypothetical protein
MLESEIQIDLRPMARLSSNFTSDKLKIPWYKGNSDVVISEMLICIPEVPVEVFMTIALMINRLYKGYMPTRADLWLTRSPISLEELCDRFYYESAYDTTSDGKLIIESGNFLETINESYARKMTKEEIEELIDAARVNLRKQHMTTRISKTQIYPMLSKATFKDFKPILTEYFLDNVIDMTIPTFKIANHLIKGDKKNEPPRIWVDTVDVYRKNKTNVLLKDVTSVPRPFQALLETGYSIVIKPVNCKFVDYKYDKTSSTYVIKIEKNNQKRKSFIYVYLDG